MADKVLVAGAGKSGIAAAKLLTGLGGEVILYDKNETLKKHVVADNFTDEELEKIANGLYALPDENIDEYLYFSYLFW